MKRHIGWGPVPHRQDDPRTEATLVADDREAVPGTVMDIEHDMARILIGPGEEEWYFPIEILPEGCGAGTELLFAPDNGRYKVLGLARTAEKGAGRSIEDRLSRPLSLRKTADLKMADLQDELDEL